MTRSQCLELHHTRTILSAMLSLGMGTPTASGFKKINITALTDENAAAVDTYIGENMADEWDD